MRPRKPRPLTLALLLAPLLGGPAGGQEPAEVPRFAGISFADDPRFLTDACADGAAGWAATAPDGTTPAGVRHQPTDGAAAPGCVQAFWERAAADTLLRLDRPVPPGAAIDELTATLAVLANHRCAAGLRVTFPHAPDPATGEPASAWITGEPAVPARQRGWRTLTVAASAAAVNDARRRVRLSLPDGSAGDGRPADLTGAAVDRVGVLLWTDGGASGPAGLRVDDVRVGPLVPVGGGLAVGPPAAPKPERHATVSGGRMTVDGDPFFPRLTFDHGVDPRALAGAGFNLIQVRDWRDRATLAKIAAAGVGAAAQPPSPGEGGAGPADLNAPADSGLAPFGPGTDPIRLWNLGPRVPGEEAWVSATAAWVDQVRAADAARGRPILVGVSGSERAFSRFTDLLGVSRMVCGTALPLWEHTALLREAADRKARPGEPLFTWIQTAPHGRTAAMREAAGLEPAVIEPELIRRQVLGAVAGGVKGIGYWTAEPLDDATPARRERRLALTLTNMQLAAVEPVLAAATKVEPIRVVPATSGDPTAVNRVRGTFGAAGTPNFGAGIGAGGAGGGDSGAFGSAFGEFGAGARPRSAATGSGASSAKPAGRCTAALLHRGPDRLVVAVWHGEQDQFVPGPAPFTTASVTIPGALPTAAAWRVTPTTVATVPHQQVTGGMKVTIPDFGDGAVLLVTPDHRGAGLLRRRVARQAPAAAAAAVELARLKLERTRDTDAALRSGVADPRWLDAHLRSAAGKLRDAERMLAHRDWDRARAAADLARRFARAVQRAHWDRLAADARLADGTTNGANGSPHLIAFSTLPDHVDLTRRLAAAGGGPVAGLLDPTRPNRTAAVPGRTVARRSPGDGGGETAFDGNVYYGAPPSVAAAAALDRGELRLSAQPKTGYERPSLLERGLVVVETPPVDVPPGHAAVIRGEVKLSGPIVGNGEGVSVHDSWAEELGGLRWTGAEPLFTNGRTGGWAAFELLRPLPPAPGRKPLPNPDGSRPITVTLGLHGLGTARFRGLTVETVDLDGTDRLAESPEPPAAPAPRLLDRLPGFLRRN